MMKPCKFGWNVLGIAFLGLFIMSSCVRERDTDVTIAQEQAMGEFVYSNALEIADDASTKLSGENLSNFKTSGYCATLTHDKVSMPRTMVIDFGLMNCMCNDNRNRKGKILVNYTGNEYGDSNGVITITFDNYYVDDYQVMGTKIVTNLGRNNLSQPHYAIEVAGKILKPNVLDTLVWNATRERIWTGGADTPVYGDDQYSYIGTGNGMNEFRSYYSSVIQAPLVKGQFCRFFNSGKVDIQSQGKALISMDYGDGNCDNQATVILNNKSFHIDL